MTSGPRVLLPVRFGHEVSDAERDGALAALDGLRVRTKAPSGRFVRTDLSVSWAKFPGVGLDMKDYIFARHLSDVTFEPDGFTVATGLLAEDPYTGQPLDFRLEEDRKRWRIEIDHVVSLKDVWTSGGHAWSPTGRNWQQVANDPGNLLPTEKKVNASKSDQTADEWVPANTVHDYRARFVVLQVAVKSRFQLSVTRDEAEAMRAMLGG
jgi:hypothetical protein